MRWISFQCIRSTAVKSQNWEIIYWIGCVCEHFSYDMKPWRNDDGEQNREKNWHIIITLHQNRFRSLEVECVVNVCFVSRWNANNACLHYLSQYFFFRFLCFVFRLVSVRVVLTLLRFGAHILYAKADTTAPLTHSHTNTHKTVCDSYWYWSSIVVKYWHSYITNFCQRINFKQI